MTHPVFANGVGALHQCPLGSVSSYLIYADVRNEMLPHHNTQVRNVQRVGCFLRRQGGATLWGGARHEQYEGQCWVLFFRNRGLNGTRLMQSSPPIIYISIYIIYMYIHTYYIYIYIYVYTHILQNEGLCTRALIKELHSAALPLPQNI